MSDPDRSEPAVPAVVAPFERPVGRLRVCDAAVEVLRETGEPGVMYGDEWLCHQIAKRLGWKPDGPWTTRRVLAAMARTPGPLIVSKIRMPSDCCARGQSVLHFELPPNVGVEPPERSARTTG